MNFGTGGWRGTLNEDFTQTNIERFTNSLTFYYKSNFNKLNPIVVGYDNRLGASKLAKLIVEYLNANGVDTFIFPESVHTPLLMYYTKIHKLDFGIMVTASHNPYTDVGIKLVVDGGLDAPKDFTDKLTEIYNDSTKNNSSTYLGKSAVIENPYDDYLTEVMSIIDFEKVKQLSHKPYVAFDAMYGSGYKLFANILNLLNIKHVPLHNTVVTINEINYIPEPSENHNSELIQIVKSDSNIDIGIAFDGDGDRLMIVDNNGDVVDMNTILCLLYKYYHEYKKLRGAIVKNCVTTSRLNQLANMYNETCYNVPVGFKWITSTMIANSALLGGESSGGLAIRDHITGKDSILATLLVLEMLADTGKTIKELVEDLNQIVTPTVFGSDKVKYDATRKSEILTNLNNYNFTEGLVSKLDGTQIFYADGSWASIRFSGTEPIIRIMAESTSKNRTLNLMAEMHHIVEQL